MNVVPTKRAGLLVVVAVALVGGAVAGSASAGARAGAAAPCLTAIVEHREHTEGADGITRDVTYRDRFQRCGDRVHTTRIVPAAAALLAKARHPTGAHEAPDVSAMPRLVVRAPDGQATLAILDAEGHRIIDVDRGSFETLRFDPSFERAASIVDAKTLAELIRLDRPSNVPNARWLGRENATRYLRVLWDEERHIALAVESGTLDGTMRDELHVTIEASAASPPAAWESAKTFAHVDFADFGD
jgi:hypothetical protein